MYVRTPKSTQGSCLSQLKLSSNLRCRQCVLLLLDVGQLVHGGLLTLTAQAYLLKKSNDCNRVCGTEHSTEEEGLKPGPVVREHILDKDGSQGGADDYTRTCQQQHLQM